MVFYARVFSAALAPTTREETSASPATHHVVPGYVARPRPAPTPHVCDLERNMDAPACLNLLGDPPLPMPPSHFSVVHGIEPFQRTDLKPFALHTIPTDEWYERAYAATESCDLELTLETQGATNGLDDGVVWVTSLLDWNRPDQAHSRSITEYFARLNLVLARQFRMVLFIPRSFEEHLNLDPRRHYVIHMNASALRVLYPYWDRVEAIRTSKLWTAQAAISGWLDKSPQATFPEYAPLEMSTLVLLRAAARINPWGSRYHLWISPGHLCATEQNPSPAGTSFYRERMAKGLFVTHWPYGTTSEVHGFNDKALHLYMAQDEDPLQIVRSGIFGGDLPHIECVLKAFTIVMHQTLTDGYLGRAENIWTIVHRRFPHLFSSFDNDSLGNHGDNCAAFMQAMKTEKAVSAGKADAFVSPPVPARAKKHAPAGACDP